MGVQSDDGRASEAARNGGKNEKDAKRFHSTSTSGKIAEAVRHRQSIHVENKTQLRKAGHSKKMLTLDNHERYIFIEVGAWYQVRNP